MRAFLFGLLAFAFPQTALAQDRENTARIQITPEGEELRVTVTLEYPTDRFAFAPADVVREDALRLDTPGMTFADDTITAEAPFSSFTYRLIEDLTERDAKYPAYYRVGEGRLVYARTLYPDPDTWDITLEIASLPEGWTRWPEAPFSQGYLFLGPQDMVEDEGGARFVFGPAVDEGLARLVRETTVESLGFLTQAFGSPPATTPFIATSRVAGETSRFTGDVTADAMIGLRFSGDDYDPSAPNAVAQTRSLILHEGVHFWNGGVAQFAQGTPQWLHEGGAEYIATLASRQLGWTTREDMQTTAASWLDRCSTSLSYSDEVALNDLTFINASLRYSCGPLLHLLAELYLAESGSAPTVIEGWRNTVRNAAATPDREYDMPDFLAALETPDLLERPALAAILAISGPERWQIVMDEMLRLGVVVEQISTPPLRARSALMHMVRGQCTQLQPGEGYGFYSYPTSYQLDTPAGCGILAGNPVVTTLANYDLTALTQSEYTALQSICAAGETIAFGLDDGGTIEVPCPAPLPDARTQPAISAFPDIPALR